MKEAIEKPNIIMIMADDQRDGTLNALGNKEIITPNLDQLAKEGMSFDNAYIMGAGVAAVCAPSRAMLMTGRTLFNIDPTGKTIDTTHITLPKSLGNAGYHSFHTGKWNNGKPAFIRSFNDGSRIFFGGMHSHYNVPTFEFNPEGNYSREEQNQSSPKHSSELYIDAGIEFLENYNLEKPFFMYLAFQAPHDPMEMPQEYLDMYDTSRLSLPPNFMSEHPFDNGELDVRDEMLAGHPRTSTEIRAHIADYYAMITHLDAQIGRLLKVLEEKGLMENTIIIFSGDNGLAVGQHGLMGKQNLYEHSINVPLIFKGPGIEKNTRTAKFAYLFDIYPTLCDFVGIDIPSSVEGESLKEVLYGKELKTREALFFAYKNFQRAVRKDNWKLIMYNVDDKITTQLFNLENDPFEIINLAADPAHKEKLSEITLLLDQQMKAYHDQADINKQGWGVPVIPSWRDRNNRK